MNRLLIVCALLALTGCSKKIEVESNACWSGQVGSSTVDGCGNRTYTLRGDPKCATLHLKPPIDGSADSLAFLRLRIKGEDWQEVHDARTYPELTVCD